MINQAVKNWLDDNESNPSIEYGELYKVLIQQVDDAMCQHLLIGQDANLSRTAEVMGIHRTTLREKARRAGVISKGKK